ncbi:hypothetical protein, partial [Escherichia coli]|uniref:hypothetical protein n=1 Tax=Escherichia coli TaxID=562 RepID=UPI0019541A26
YDLFALRTIGRGDVPYRIAALAGFTSYSVGHNVGASVLTGGDEQRSEQDVALGLILQCLDQVVDIEVAQHV